MLKRIAFIFIILTNFSKISFCCDCGPISIKQGIESSDIVVKGEIISKEVITNYKTGYKEARFKMVVLEKYKANLTADTFTIITNVDGGMCGYKFEIGQKYIVYGNFIKIQDNFYELNPLPRNSFATNSCTRTMIYNSNEIEAIKNILK